MPFLLRLLLVVAAGSCIVGARLATRHYLGRPAEASPAGSHARVEETRLLTHFP